jgi:hypothetical protein
MIHLMRVRFALARVNCRWSLGAIAGGWLTLAVNERRPAGRQAPRFET